MSSIPAQPIVFSATELDLLGRTADALSAYMGKPVLAEVAAPDETGFEYVVFAIPLESTDGDEDKITVQVGGAKARLLGNKGGLTVREGDLFSCEYLWAVQLSSLEGIRFIKVDGQGEEVAWAQSLDEILPFAMGDDHDVPDDDDDDT